MLPTDKPQFLSVLNGLAAIKPGAKITSEALDLWWASFADWTIDEFKSAAAHLAKSCEFFPNPYHFEQLRKAQEPTAGEAWAHVRAVARVGGSTSGNARVDRVARVLGGYAAIGRTNTDQMHFLERRFSEHYEAISNAQDVRQALPNLASLSRLPYNPNKFLEQS